MMFVGSELPGHADPKASFCPLQHTTCRGVQAMSKQVMSLAAWARPAEALARLDMQDDSRRFTASLRIWAVHKTRA